MKKQVHKKKEFFSRENLKYQNDFLAEKLKNIINVALKSKMNDLRQSQRTVLKQSENLLHFIKSLEIVLDEERAFQTPVSFLVALKKYHVIQPVKLETKLISRFSEENIEKGTCQKLFFTHGLRSSSHFGRRTTCKWKTYPHFSLHGEEDLGKLFRDTVCA